MNKIATFFTALCTTTAFANDTFDGSYAGLSLATTTNNYSISDQTLTHDKRQEKKTLSLVAGYGQTLKSFPLYIGGELNMALPLGTQKDSFDISSVVLGQRASYTHTLQTKWPIEAALKVGYPIDTNVLLYGKAGLFHQQVHHKVSQLNHSSKKTLVSPLFGVGLSFAVNGKWMLHTDYTFSQASEHKSLIFSHKKDQQRIQLSVNYRF